MPRSKSVTVIDTPENQVIKFALTGSFAAVKSTLAIASTIVANRPEALQEAAEKKAAEAAAREAAKATSPVKKRGGRPVGSGKKSQTPAPVVASIHALEQEEISAAAAE